MRFALITLIAALSLAAALPARALEDDKRLHLGASFVVGLAAANQWPREPLKAWSVAMVPGVLKELSDRGSTGFSGRDLAFDALGAALGVATGRWLVTRRDGATVVVWRTEF